MRKTKVDIRSFAAAWFLVLAMVAPALAAGDITVIGLLPYGGAYVEDAWSPVKVEVVNPTDAEINGSVRVLLTAPGTPEYRTPMHVPANCRASRVIWLRLHAAKQPGVATGKVTLNDAGGAVIARTELAGAPSVLDPQWLPNGLSDSAYAVAVVGREMTSDQTALDGLGELLQSNYEIRTVRCELDVPNAPPVAVPYSAALFVQLRGIAPDALSPAQREAILDYVRSGGVLLIAAPEAERIGNSWLAQYLPVKLIGNRESKEVPSPKAGGKLAFGMYLNCAEALPADGTVLLADEEYVHVAYRPLGLGRVVFTSFPASALDAKDDVAARLWRDALGLDRQPVGPAGSALASEYPVLMEPMLGRQAASWSVATAVAAGLVLLLLALHIGYRGPARPKAFQYSIALSVLVALGFWAMAAMRQETEPLQQARLGLVDATGEGTFCTEYAAASGRQDLVWRQVDDARSPMYAPLLRQDRPVIDEWPTAIQQISLLPQQVNLVSEATRWGMEHKASAIGKFTAEGLVISLRNGLGFDLGSAQLCWLNHRLSLPDIAGGEASVKASQANLRPADEYTAASGLTSQSEQQRGQILKASLESTARNSKPRQAWPTVVGWTEQWPALTSLSQSPDRSASQTLVRIPLVIAPSDPGKVAIDGVFNQLVFGENRGLPYDTMHQEFLRSSLTGTWVLGFQPPRQIGLIRPEKVHFVLDLQAPQNHVTLRRGQCRDGKLAGNAGGEVLGEWTSKVGNVVVQFDCTPGDYDAEGRVWLRLEVASSGALGALGVEPTWQIGQCLMDIEGQVITESAKHE